MKRILKFIILPSLLLLTGCATIVNGTDQIVGITSKPGCADVKVDNHFVGTTPINVNLSRDRDHTIRIELDGYEPYEIVCNRKMSKWVFGNLLFGGPFGLVIDIVSGGVYRLTPEQVNADLCGNRMICCKKHQKSTIAVVMKPEPSWKKVGQLKRAG